MPRIVMSASLLVLLGTVAPLMAQPTFDPFSPMALVLSPDGTKLATAELRKRGLQGGVVSIVDVASGRQIRAITWQDRTIYDLAFSPDSKGLAICGGDHVSSMVRESDVRVVDVESGKETFTFPTQLGIVRTVRFFPDGKHLLIGCAGTSKGPKSLIGDLSSGKTQPLADWKVIDGEAAKKYGNGPSLPFPHQGTLLAGTRTGELIDLKTGTKVAEIGKRARGIAHVASSGDGKLVAIVEQTAWHGPGESGIIDGEGAIHLYDTTTWKIVRKLRGHHQQIVCATFSPANDRLLTGSLDKSARIWDLETGKEVAAHHHEGRVLTVAFSPDGKKAVSAGAGDKGHVWDPATGKRIAE